MLSSKWSSIEDEMTDSLPVCSLVFQEKMEKRQTQFHTNILPYMFASKGKIC
jgi:hypothetical protein